MTILRASTVECDSAVTTDPNRAHQARLIMERIARINYVIDCHRQGIALQSRRRAELQDELERLGVQG